MRGWTDVQASVACIVEKGMEITLDCRLSGVAKLKCGVFAHYHGLYCEMSD